MKKVKFFDTDTFREVGSVCNKLIKNTNIILFYHARLYNNGKYFLLSNHSEWIWFKFSKMYKIVPPFPKELNCNRFNFIIESVGGCKEALQSAEKNFGIVSPIYFVEKNPEYSDVFCYASSNKKSKNDNINFYINNQRFLCDFTCYFRNNAAGLVNDAMANLAVLPRRMRVLDER